MARPFSNDMFQDGYEPNYEPDYSGIMNPELTDAVAMRKDANESAKGATDQYEADVADYKNGQATEAEEGIASLPDFPSFSMPDIDYTNINPTLFGYDVNLPDYVSSEDFQFDDVDLSGYYPEETTVDPSVNPYVNAYVQVPDNKVIDNVESVPGEPEPVYDPYIPEESVYVPPVETVETVETVAPVYQTPTANSIDDTTTYTPPNTNSNSPAIGDIDSETGLVWDGGTFVRPESWNGNMVNDDYIWDGRDWVAGSGTGLPDLGIVDPNAGANSGEGGLINNSDTGGDTIGTGTDSGDVYDGNPNSRFEEALPPPPPSGLGFNDLDLSSFGTAPEMGLTQIPKATYVGLNKTTPTDAVLAANLAAFQRPANTTAESFPAFAGVPVVEEEEVTGLAYGGRVPMGNNNRLNSGLSRLPINQQNDTLTQVFQSGFRPRR